MSDTVDISLRAEDEFSKVFKKYNDRYSFFYLDILVNEEI